VRQAIQQGVLFVSGPGTMRKEKLSGYVQGIRSNDADPLINLHDLAAGAHASSAYWR